MLKVRLGNEDKFEIEQYQYNAQIMGDVNLTTDIFLSSEDAVFNLGMYVNINDENLYLTSAEPTGEKNNTNTLEKYTLYFESKRVELKRKYFRDLTSNGTGVDWGTSFSFYGNLYDFADRLQKNLDKYFGIGTYIITEIPVGYPLTKLLFTADNLYLFDALNTMSEIYYGLEWRISAEGDIFNIEIDPEEVVLTHTFEYEGDNIGKGLTLIQKNVDTSNIVTRMLSAGSTKNIPYGYFRDYSEQGYLPDTNIAPDFAIGFFNLMPKCFREYISGYNNQSFGSGTDAWEQGHDDFVAGVYNPITYYDDYNISKWGIREGVVEVNEEIFPTIEGIDLNNGVPPINLANEVVAVEQVNFDNDEAYEEYDDDANIVHRRGSFAVQHYNQPITGSTSIIVSDYIDEFEVQDDEKIVFDFILNISFEPNPNKVSVRNINVIVQKYSGGIWIDYPYLMPSNKSDYNFGELYRSEVNSIIFDSDATTNYRLKFIAEVSIPTNTDTIICDISGAIINLRVVNNSYAKQTTISNILHNLNCINPTNSTIQYSNQFEIVDGDYDVTIENAKIVGKVQYDYNIPNPNDIHGTLMFDNNLIIQKYDGSNWIDFDIKKLAYSLTRISNLHVSQTIFWNAADIVGEEKIVFEAIPIGTYRIKTLLSISKIQVGSITPQATWVSLDLQNIYYGKTGYKPTFYVWIKDVFNLTQKNLYLTGIDPQINFTTGNLAGDEHAFMFDPSLVIEDNSKSLSGVSSKWRLTCWKSKADEEATGFSVPNTRKQGKAGDKFVLLGINMPYDPYVLTAEQKLEDYVKDELNKVSNVKRDFSLTLYDPFISGFSDKDKLLPSNYIKVKHDALIGGILQVQIKGVTITQNKGAVYPTYSLELSDKSSITPIKRRGLLGRLEDTTATLLRDTQTAFRGLREVSGSVKRKADNTISESRYSLSKGIGSNAHVLIGDIPDGKSIAGILGDIPQNDTVFGITESLNSEIGDVKKVAPIFNNYDHNGVLNITHDANIDLELENNGLKATAIDSYMMDNTIYHTGAKGFAIKKGETITFILCIYTGMTTNREITLDWEANPISPVLISTSHYLIQGGLVLNYINWEYTADEDIILSELHINLNGSNSPTHLSQGDSFKILLSRTKLFLGTQTKIISASYNDTQKDIENIYEDIENIYEDIQEIKAYLEI